MNQIKPAFLCTSQSWGGLEMNVIKLAEILKNAGYSVMIISEEGNKISQISKSKKIEFANIPKHFKYFDLLVANDLKSILIKNKITHLYVSHNRDVDLASNVKIFYKSFKLIYQQNMHLGRMKKDFFHNLRFSRYDFWITPLNTLADEVRNMTNFNPKKIRIAPYGVDISRFNSNRKTKIECREILGISNNKFIFGIIGRIDKQKGQLDLVKAFNNVIKEDKEIELIIMGEKTIGESNEYYDELIKFINENKLIQNIKILPFSNEVSTFYTSIDCLVMASASETYGMVTIEAMLLEVPVIGTNRGGTIEILDNGNLGVLYKPRDINELTNAMIEVKNNYSKYIEIAKLAKFTAYQKYTDAIELQENIKILNE
jgi:glycosyltransferase involved in cell wall biosynthesis